MKQKVLITLGDSWTEGVGAYNPPIDSNIDNPLTDSEIQQTIETHFKSNIENFHKNSWCNLVGQKLGFDKVFNLGRISASNSENVKILNDFLYDFPTSEYEILVIWLMTEPSRFSFYIDGTLKSYQPSFSHLDKLAYEYLNEIKHINLDTLLEQKFYVQMMENLCQVKGIDLLITSWHETFPLLYKLYKTKNYLDSYPKFLQPPNESKNDNTSHLYYSFCSHPNKEGYEWIANEIIQSIKQNHSKWYSDSQNENFEWDWRGCIIHNNIFD